MPSTLRALTCVCKSSFFLFLCLSVIALLVCFLSVFLSSISGHSSHPSLCLEVFSFSLLWFRPRELYILTSVFTKLKIRHERGDTTKEGCFALHTHLSFEKASFHCLEYWCDSLSSGSHCFAFCLFQRLSRIWFTFSLGFFLLPRLFLCVTTGTV